MTNLEKKKRKRWGKKFIDKRDWPVVNEQYVKRGEIWLDFDWVKGWDDELEMMNANKIGRPYQFPKSMIEFQAALYTRVGNYRGVKGVTRRLVELCELRKYNDFSTINRRVNALDYRLALPQSDHVVLYSDGSGFQAIEGGEYLREKYGKKNRKFIQIIILGDAKTNEPVSFEVNIIQESEPESAQRQMEALQKQGVIIDAFGGDGAFDKIELWKWLEEQGIEPIIKTDENARDDGESAERNKNVKEKRRLGYKKWARRHKYGPRWPPTEGIFSAVKRIFGEQIHAKSEKGMLAQASCKIWMYQRLKRYGEA